MTLFKITTLLCEIEQDERALHGKRLQEFYVLASSETQAVDQLVQEWNRLGLRHNGRADIIAINNLACAAEEQNAKYILVQQPIAQFVAEPFFPVDTTKPAGGQYSGRVKGRPLPPNDVTITRDQLRDYLSEHFNRPGVLVTRNATGGVDVSKYFPVSLMKKDEK